MSTHNIHFYDKMGKIPTISVNMCFLKLSKEFPKDSKARISHSKRVMLLIEVLLYFILIYQTKKTTKKQAFLIQKLKGPNTVNPYCKTAFVPKDIIAIKMNSLLKRILNEYNNMQQMPCLIFLYKPYVLDIC